MVIPANIVISTWTGVQQNPVKMVPSVGRRRTHTSVPVPQVGLGKSVMFKWFLVRMLPKGKVIIIFMSNKVLILLKIL